MAFDGSEGAPINMTEAAVATKEWRTQFPDQVQANFIGVKMIQQLLNQEGAIGIRVHYGLDSEGVMKPIFTAAKRDESDILALIGDFTTPCPPRCGAANPLNS